MLSIEDRCQRRSTRAFVTPDTVDLLGEKMIGIIGDRRATKTHRYIGKDRTGTPTVQTGLRLWHGGMTGPITVRSRQSVSVQLANHQHYFEGVGLHIGWDTDIEQQVAERYDNPEQQWLGQRRDITLVDLTGWPGSPGPDDRIRIEYWNEHGVGQETIVVFDDVDLVQEIAWDVKRDKERQVWMDDHFCHAHNRHAEDPEHAHESSCVWRRATLAENLAVLAHLAARNETTEGGDR